jgi:hypothetical protein
MPGPPPKALDVKTRRHKSATRATLGERDGDIEIPPLPRHFSVQMVDGKQRRFKTPWHPMTVAWWEDIWPSPMAAEWHKSDIHGLYAVALLYNNFFECPDSKTHAELRLARMPYGLTPLDRRRLEWTVENTEKVKADGEQRRQAATIAPPTPAGDQDKRLHVV